MDRVKAEGILTEILKPINEGAENPEKITWMFTKFCEIVYLPACHRKWKASTDMVETNRLEVHLVRPLGAKLMQEITRSELQALLDEQVRSCGRKWSITSGFGCGRSCDSSKDLKSKFLCNISVDLSRIGILEAYAV